MVGRISRQGLCRCPQCNTHVRLEDFSDAATRACAGCGAELTRDALVAEQVERGVLASLRSMARGRGGLLAAGLLSLSTLGAAGCSDSSGSGDAAVKPDSGTGKTDGTAGDAPQGPDLMSKADQGTPAPDQATPDQATPKPDQAVTKPDVGRPGREAGITPLYGIPPLVDGTIRPRDGGSFTRELGITPLYGKPPSPKQ